MRRWTVDYAKQRGGPVIQRSPTRRTGEPYGFSRNSIVYSPPSLVDWHMYEIV